MYFSKFTAMESNYEVKLCHAENFLDKYATILDNLFLLTVGERVSLIR